MGLVALLLASMGIYGVTAYTVALRRREFAIRLALGAPRARVVRMVFRQGTWLVAVGLGIGLALAIGAGHVLSVFFYGLPAAHVPTLLGTVVLFVAIGAAASVVPAGQAVRDGWRRRASRGLRLLQLIEIRHVGLETLGGRVLRIAGHELARCSGRERNQTDRAGSASMSCRSASRIVSFPNVMVPPPK